MKKVGIVLLIVLLSILLWACGEKPTINATSSTPSVSQPDGQELAELPSRRPVHNLQSFNGIVGWYEIEYREDTRYPSRVTTTNFEGVVKQIYELVFDERGVPVNLNVRDNKGNLKDTHVELFCDEQGNITNVVIYDDEEENVSKSFLLTYDEHGRMVTTTQQEGDVVLELTYDARYCITQAVMKTPQKTQLLEMGYDKNYKLIKRLIRNEKGVVTSGYEEIYDEAGMLQKYHKYKNGVIVQEKQYNEKGLVVVELSRTSNGQKTIQIANTYDELDRVAKITLLENDQMVRWTDITYESLTSTAVTYDADGKITEKRYLETDEKNNVLKKIIRDGDDNILETDEYAYNEDGVKIMESQYTYRADGTLIKGEKRTYDAQARQIGYFRYSENGLKYGSECEWYAEGLRLWQKTYESDGSYTVDEYIPGTRICRKSATYNAEGVVIASFEGVYDENNVPLQTTECREDGTKVVSSYNKNHDVTEEILYDVDGKVTSRKVYVYNDASQELSIITYGPDNEIVDRIEYTYNEDGRRAQMATYGSDGKLTERMEYVYHDNGQKKSVTTYGADGQILRRIEYTYYDSGYLKSVITYGPDGTVIKEKHYEENYKVIG